MRRLAQVLAGLGAVLALGSAWLHGVVARPVVLGRVSGHVDAQTLAGVNAAWILGSAAMAGFAIVVLAGLPLLGRAPGAGRAQAIAGLFMLGYGAWAYAYRGGHPHFIGFMGIGALWIASAWLARRARPAG